MLPPEKDQADRRSIWNALQTFWMDSDPNLDLTRAAELCVNSKYSLSEIEEIYWNEVRPAVRFNLFSPVREWAGFDIDWLAPRIISVNNFGKRLPTKLLHPHSGLWVATTILRDSTDQDEPGDPGRLPRTRGTT